MRRENVALILAAGIGGAIVVSLAFGLGFVVGRRSAPVQVVTRELVVPLPEVARQPADPPAEPAKRDLTLKQYMQLPVAERQVFCEELAREHFPSKDAGKVGANYREYLRSLTFQITEPYDSRQVAPEQRAIHKRLQTNRVERERFLSKSVRHELELLAESYR